MLKPWDDFPDKVQDFAIKLDETELFTHVRLNPYSTPVEREDGTKNAFADFVISNLIPVVEKLGWEAEITRYDVSLAPYGDGREPDRAILSTSTPGMILVPIELKTPHAIAGRIFPDIVDVHKTFGCSPADQLCDYMCVAKVCLVVVHFGMLIVA